MGQQEVREGTVCVMATTLLLRGCVLLSRYGSGLEIIASFGSLLKQGLLLTMIPESEVQAKFSRTLAKNAAKLWRKNCRFSSCNFQEKSAVVRVRFRVRFENGNA